MSKIPRLLVFHVRSVWPWLASALLLVTISFVVFIKLPEMGKRNLLLRKRINALDSELNIRSAAAKSVSSRWYIGLPEFGRLATVVDDLQSIAASDGMVLTDVSYKLNEDRGVSQIAKIGIDARTKGDYLALKRWVSALHASHPELALESCSLRRNRSTDAVMDIELRFSFFYRQET